MASDVPYRPSRLQDSALRWGPRIAVGTVLAAAAINWAGWATGIETLTRGFPSWPQMTPWSALLVALFGFVSTTAMAKFLLRGEVIE